VLRFLLTPRWLGLLLVVLVVGAVCILAGRWQFQRYDDRLARNEVTRQNLSADPRPVDDLLSSDQGPSADQEWRRVVATGTYDDENPIVVRYRTRDGAAGVDLVVPLVTVSGVALLVDRGWLATSNNADPPDLPPSPDGQVSVTGWVRVDATGEGIDVVDSSVRAISSARIGAVLPYDVYTGFVDAIEEEPAGSATPLRADEPDLSSGPHFFYGVQWWFFALLALGFWVYFGWAEYRDRSRTAGASSQRTPVTTPE